MCLSSNVNTFERNVTCFCILLSASDSLFFACRLATSMCTLQASNNKISNSSTYSTQLCYFNVCAEYIYSKYAEYNRNKCLTHTNVLFNFILLLHFSIARCNAGADSSSQFQCLYAIFLSVDILQQHSMPIRCFSFYCMKGTVDNNI